MVPTPTIPKFQHYLVILCGGTGPRLWPLSRAYHPKQFLRLFSKKSLLQTTVLRAKSIVDSQNILIISNQKYRPLVSQELKSLIPKDNLIFEPSKKNTAMAVVYATAIIKARNPTAVISILPSDHFIDNSKNFKLDLARARNYALADQRIVLIGIKPISPDPSYGYLLHRGHLVTKFVEKPDTKTALRLIKDKALWNSGIYTFTIPTLTNELVRHSRGYLSLLNQIENHLQNPKMIGKIYQSSGSLSLDYALTEKSQKLSVVKSSFKWNDIGEWQSVYQQLKSDKSIATISANTQVVVHDSQNCLVEAPKNKLITLLGVNNLAVIDTPDALLVCPLDQSFQVRNLVGDIVQSKYKKYFLGRNEKT